MTGFKVFSTTHLITLLIIVLINIGFFIFLRGKDNQAINRYFRNSVSIIMVTLELSLILWYIVIGEFYWGSSLPLHLCRLSALMSAYMLIKDSDRAFQVIFFFGTIGSLLALLTPDLKYTFPHFLFLKFFVNHSLIMTSILYMIIIEKFKPRFGSIFKAFGVLNILTVIIFFVNKLTNGNYFFLSHKPNSDTLLNYFPDGILYYVSLEIVAIILFLISYFLGVFVWNLTNKERLKYKEKSEKIEL